MIKRAFDLLTASVALVVVSPLIAIVAALITFDSPGPVFFRQQRIGKGFRPFEIYKFRTMVVNSVGRGPKITAKHDLRITRIGRILRRTKLDELPQLVNVLKGEMSIVGPRPEIRQYVDLFREDYSALLRVRPGLTDLAALSYPDEEQVLARSDDPLRTYRERILPHKIQLSKESLRRSSFFYDLSVIFRTLFSIAERRH